MESRAQLRTVAVPAAFEPLFHAAEAYVEAYFRSTVQDPERSLIQISGERYVLVRAASLSIEFFDLVCSLYQDRSIEEARNVANNLLFDIAHAIGKADARAFHEKMGVRNPIEKLSAGPIHFSFSGWAFVDIHSESVATPDQNYCLIYDHPFSFEADAWLRRKRISEKPVCIMNAGYSSGWCEESFGLPLVAVELECTAAGGNRCHFVMAPPAEIERHVERLARPQFARSSAGNKGLQEIPEFFQRKRLEEALRQSESKFRILAETIPQQVWISDPDGSVNYVNEQWHRFRGIGLAESAGSGWRVSIHPDDLLEVERKWNHSIATGEPFEHTYRVCRADSKTYSWVLGRAIPLRDEHGRIVRWYGTNTDIDAQKKSEAALRRTEKLAATGRLAATIAHEINNPLASVMNLVYLAQRETGVSDQTRLYLQVAEQELKRVAQTAKRTLGFYRESSSPEAVEISELLDEVLAVFEKRISERRIRVLKRYQRPGSIICNRGEVHQVFANLIANALEASDNGSALHVRAARRSRGQVEGVQVCIADSGLGIVDANSKHVFEPFFTTKKNVGTGLGLWITHTIVAKHGGAIRFRSSVQPGRSGTVFQVFLGRELQSSAAQAGSSE